MAELKKERVIRRYEYRVTFPMLSPNHKDSPVMDHRDMEWWLNDMDAQGWEFVGYGEKNWRGGELNKQEWWIFRRLANPKVANLIHMTTEDRQVIRSLQAELEKSRRQTRLVLKAFIAECDADNLKRVSPAVINSAKTLLAKLSMNPDDINP